MEYKIIDEPAPTALSRFVVNPVWIIFATMFFKWVGWVWFLFNGFALNSPTKKKELSWVLGGVFLGLGLIYLLTWGLNSGSLSKASGQIIWPYFSIVITVIYLTVGYRLFLYQARPFQLFQYYKKRNYE